MKHCFMKRAYKTDTLNQYLEHDFDEIESIDSEQSMNGYDGLSLDKWIDEQICIESYCDGSPVFLCVSHWLKELGIDLVLNFPSGPGGQLAPSWVRWAKYRKGLVNNHFTVQVVVVVVVVVHRLLRSSTCS